MSEPAAPVLFTTTTTTTPMPTPATREQIATRAATVIDAWLKDRSISLHRDERWYLIERLADEFSKVEKKPGDVPEGVS